MLKGKLLCDTSRFEIATKDRFFVRHPIHTDSVSVVFVPSINLKKSAFSYTFDLWARITLQSVSDRWSSLCRNSISPCRSSTWRARSVSKHGTASGKCRIYASSPRARKSEQVLLRDEIVILSDTHILMRLDRPQKASSSIVLRARLPRSRLLSGIEKENGVHNQ